MYFLYNLPDKISDYKSENFTFLLDVLRLGHQHWTYCTQLFNDFFIKKFASLIVTIVTENSIHL